MRRRTQLAADHPELQPRELVGPVFIAGMGARGRAVADALTHFGIDYAAMERDQHRMRNAIADGYRAVFGDIADPRIWEPVAMQGRKIIVLTAPSHEISSQMTPITQRFFPELKRVAVVNDHKEAARFAEIGLTPVVDSSEPRGLDAAKAVLGGLDVEFSSHGTVCHSANQYARSGGFIHVNTAENCFSIFKCGVIGPYHHSQRPAA